ncbi:MAG: RdgB/HAM1 family non-canonical purine NTP pyrophosphatase [Candidatus Nanopelagicales bacterium]
MSIEIVFASKNAHKLQEVERIVDSVCKDFSIVGLHQWDDAPDVVESGTTFAANALLKARSIHQHTGRTVIADDSGICVDALNGMPGIFSARWAGNHGRDSENLQLLLSQIEDVPDQLRGAQFVCAVAIVLEDGTERVVEGILEGVITRAPKGEGGFGYDPIFQPVGLSVTTAELDAVHKDLISHRGQAVRSAIAELKSLYNLGCGGDCACKS